MGQTRGRGLGDDELDGTPRTPKRDTHFHDRWARRFSWKRVLRGLGIGLSLLWFVLIWIVIPGTSPRSPPYRVWLAHTLITILATTLLVLCLRGRSRIVIGSLATLLTIWWVWDYWHHWR